MALVTPVTLFPGFTSDATGITIPYTALGGLIQAEANPTTGNAAKVLYEILNSSYPLYNALASNAKSASMTFTRANLQAAGQNDVTRSFALGFSLSLPATTDVAPEP